jgi:hypothetical protein
MSSVPNGTTPFSQHPPNVQVIAARALSRSARLRRHGLVWAVDARAGLAPQQPPAQARRRAPAGHGDGRAAGAAGLRQPRGDTERIIAAIVALLAPEARQHRIRPRNNWPAHTRSATTATPPRRGRGRPGTDTGRCYAMAPTPETGHRHQNPVSTVTENQAEREMHFSLRISDAEAVMWIVERTRGSTRTAPRSACSTDRSTPSSSGGGCAAQRPRSPGCGSMWSPAWAGSRLRYRPPTATSTSATTGARLPASPRLYPSAV